MSAPVCVMAVARQHSPISNPWASPAHEATQAPHYRFGEMIPPCVERRVAFRAYEFFLGEPYRRREISCAEDAEAWKWKPDRPRSGPRPQPATQAAPLQKAGQTTEPPPTSGARKLGVSASIT